MGDILGLNNFWEFTKSQKISRGAYIIDFVVDKIDNNQNIKRFMRYHTLNPLAKKSKNYEGVEIIQKDLKDSLTVKSYEISVKDKGEHISYDKSLYNRAFNENMIINKQNYIFVENNHNIYNGDFATMYFKINILTPATYLDIEDEETGIHISRNKAIACVIDGMLDGYIVDEQNYSDLVGNIQFNLADYSEMRLSSSNDIVLTTLIYKVKTLGLRVDI